MKRRDFITLFGSAAASLLIWPLAARAQQDRRMRRIGVLWPFPENDPLGQADMADLRQALHSAAVNCRHRPTAMVLRLHGVTLDRPPRLKRAREAAAPRRSLPA